MKKIKHIPIRKCIGCGIQKPKSKFIMVVKPPEKFKDSRLYVKTETINKEGRAAYVCKKLECVNKAKKGRRIEKAFSCKVDSEIYTNLEVMVKKDE